MSGSNKIKELIVLCPNGRRVTIKQSILTSIGQIIEEACLKHSFDPYNYNLKHLNRLLDASSTLQYSNIPNHAQLELVEAPERRKEGFVTVNLVTDTGQRLIEDFAPSSTLWDVLLHHALSVPAGMEAFVVYTMRRVVGEDLKRVTLKSLGLFGGRCMMRYNVQSIPSTTGDSGLTESSPVVVKPKIFVTKRTDTSSSETAKKETSPVRAIEKVELKTEVECEEEKMECEDNKQRQDEGAKQSVETFVPMEETKVKVEEVEEKKVKHGELRVSSEGSGVEHHKDDCKENVPVQNICSTNTKCHEEISEHKCSEDRTPTPKIIPLCPSHNAVLFSLDDALPPPPSRETDDFFDLSLDEVKGLYREHVKELRELEEAPLMTQQLRQLDKDSRLLTAMNRHPVTQLRVCFPDRHVIQANFKPRTTIREVMQFLTPFLVHNEIKFYLYTTFPRQVVSPEMSLVDAGCIPKARLYFGCDEEAYASSSSFLSDKTLENKSSFEGAASAVIRSSIRPSKSEASSHARSVSEVPLKKSSTPAQLPPGPSPSRTNTSHSQQKPKWFKLGK